MKEVRLHGANRAAENLRDVLVGQLMIRAKDERGALFSRQPRDGRPDLRGGFRALECPFGRLRPGIDALDCLKKFLQICPEFEGPPDGIAYHFGRRFLSSDASLSLLFSVSRCIKLCATRD